jgi:aryl-alcohol dehydrogenase-like predicted oxidoreductase
VPIEETASAMADLQRLGKIRAIGVSNLTVAQMQVFGKIAPIRTAQPPYNLFERAIEQDVLPYCRDRNLVTLAYGALCRGLLSGRMTRQTRFSGDDLRNTDPKFRLPHFAQYLKAVEQLDRFARENYRKPVIELAVRWILDRQPSSIALWGARRPEQLAPVSDLPGWHLDESAMLEIDRILDACIGEPLGPEFMAPPARAAA